MADVLNLLGVVLFFATCIALVLGMRKLRPIGGQAIPASERSIRGEVLRQREEAQMVVSEQAASRQGLGLGFWRLVSIVALGVLIAQAIGALAAYVIRAIAAAG